MWLFEWNQQFLEQNNLAQLGVEQSSCDDSFCKGHRCPFEGNALEGTICFASFESAGASPKNGEMLS